MKSFKLFGTTFELVSIRKEKYDNIKTNISTYIIEKKFISEIPVHIIYMKNGIKDTIFSMSFDGLRFIFNKKTNKIEKYITLFDKAGDSKFYDFCENMIGVNHMSIREYNIFNKSMKNNITILDIGLDFNKFEEKIKMASLFM